MGEAKEGIREEGEQVMGIVEEIVRRRRRKSRKRKKIQKRKERERKKRN